MCKNLKEAHNPALSLLLRSDGIVASMSMEVENVFAWAAGIVAIGTIVLAVLSEKGRRILCFVSTPVWRTIQSVRRYFSTHRWVHTDQIRRPIPRLLIPARWKVTRSHTRGVYLLHNTSTGSVANNVMLELIFGEARLVDGARWASIDGGSSQPFRMEIRRDGPRGFGMVFQVVWLDSEGAQWEIEFEYDET